MKCSLSFAVLCRIFLYMKWQAGIPDRVTYMPKDLGIDSIEMFGFNASRQAGAITLGPHSHDESFEICLIEDGAVEWWAHHEDQVYEIGSGQIYVTRPGELHGAVNATIHPSRFFWLMCCLETGPENLSPKERKQIREALTACPRQFEASDITIEMFRRMLREVWESHSMSKTMLRSQYASLMIQIHRDALEANAPERKVSPEIKRSQTWMSERLEHAISIEEAADVAGLSVTRFHERFRLEVGLSPADWRQRHRINLAKRLLSSPSLTVTEIAYRCGYSTSQYFATAFRNTVGLTPSEYRKSMNASEA